MIEQDLGIDFVLKVWKKLCKKLAQIRGASSTSSREISFGGGWGVGGGFAYARGRHACMRVTCVGAHARVTRGREEGWPDSC